MLSPRIVKLVRGYVQFHSLYRRLFTMPIVPFKPAEITPLFRGLSTVSTSVNADLVEPPQNELYSQIKLCANLLISDESESKTEAGKILETIGYKHLDKEESTQKSDAEKFPINTNQVLFLIHMFRSSTSLSTPIESARQFLIMLVEMKLVKLDDNWIKVLIQAVLESRPNNPVEALHAYKAISQLQPYPKIYPASMFMILDALMKKDKKKLFYKQAIEVIEAQSTSKPHYLEGAVLLANGKPLEYLDKLKNADRSFGADDLRKLCRVAALTKEPKILEPLVQFYQILPNHHDSCLELYNTLANLYGKKKDLDALDVLWKALDAQYNLSELRHYRHVLQRCRHYFRCNNRRTPDELFLLLQKLGDF